MHTTVGVTFVSDQTWENEKNKYVPGKSRKQAHPGLFW